MTTEPAPRIKITYATLRNDNEELHAQFEAGVDGGSDASSAAITATTWRAPGATATGTFEVRSPIDTDIAGRDVRERHVGRYRRCRRRRRVPPSRPGPRSAGRAASRSSSGPRTSSATG